MRPNPLFLLLALLWPATAMADEALYFLTPVDTVRAGDRIVMERNGGVLNEVATTTTLPVTFDYATTDLTGSESYVWLLQPAVGGFLIRGQYDLYLINPNTSNSNLAIQVNPVTIWKFEFAEDSTATIISTVATGNRFIGETAPYSGQYKAYGRSMLTAYGHSFRIYRLDLPAPEEPKVTALAEPAGTPDGGWTKLLRHGGLYIVRDGCTYNAQGRRVL